jgi:hypothetical protein
MLTGTTKFLIRLKKPSTKKIKKICKSWPRRKPKPHGIRNQFRLNAFSPAGGGNSSATPAAKPPKK